MNQARQSTPSSQRFCSLEQLGVAMYITELEGASIGRWCVPGDKCVYWEEREASCSVATRLQVVRR
jgi:hypothetical protein